MVDSIKLIFIHKNLIFVTNGHKNQVLVNKDQFDGVKDKLESQFPRQVVLYKVNNHYFSLKTGKRIIIGVTCIYWCMFLCTAGFVAVSQYAAAFNVLAGSFLFGVVLSMYRT